MERVWRFRIPRSLWILACDLSFSSSHCSLIFMTLFFSADKVYKEFMLYAIGRNINKYHRFLYEKLRKFEGKTA